jgi:chorismate mutase/prephenate dehydratase
MCVTELQRIDSLREEIDRIDRNLIELLSERAACALAIGPLKQALGLPTFDAGREREVMDALLSHNDGPLKDSALNYIFTEIISACRALQCPTKVAYLGPEATFSHTAALEYFGRSSTLLPRDSIVDVFREVESGQADFGVVPVENSTEGAVGLTLDQLATSELSVCGEILLPVSHALMSRTADLDLIESVYSHPQALAQCFGWLAGNLPGRAIVQTPSTAAAAKRATQEPGAAAVGSEMLARLYGLEVISRNIQDRSVNLTRFLILGKAKNRMTGKDKTSLLFTARHQPGSLLAALTPFAGQGINLTRIESRPSKEKLWTYIFFVDIEGHLSEDRVKAALEELSACVDNLKILGCYPKAELSDGRPISRESAATRQDQSESEEHMHLQACSDGR